jgi:hypothetical protein
MQYWIFFVGGVGGDGFANLLEHATNVEPVDGDLCWRVTPAKNGSNKMMFNFPLFVNDVRFFRDHSSVGELRPPNYVPQPLNINRLQPTENYRRIVDHGINTVISTHPWWYNYNKDFKHWDLLEKDQHKILLYSNDLDRIVNDFCDKNNMYDQYRVNYKEALQKYSPPYYNVPKLNYQTLIDIDQVWRDWEYLDKILKHIGLDLDRKYYEEYLDVAKKR